MTGLLHIVARNGRLCLVAGLLAGLALPGVAAALRPSLPALVAVLLFLLSLRRSGERAGRLAERLEATEKANDVQCRMLEAAARRPRYHHELAERLSGCATVRSEDGRLATCPPVVEYGREFQARAAEDLALLPQGSAVAEMLSDYAVMREQARFCVGRLR